MKTKIKHENSLDSVSIELRTILSSYSIFIVSNTHDIISLINLLKFTMNACGAGVQFVIHQETASLPVVVHQPQTGAYI